MFNFSKFLICFIFWFHLWDLHLFNLTDCKINVLHNFRQFINIIKIIKPICFTNIRGHLLHSVTAPVCFCVAVVWENFQYVITVSSHRIFICKRKYTPPDPVMAWWGTSPVLQTFDWRIDSPSVGAFEMTYGPSIANYINKSHKTQHHLSQSED